MSSHPPGALVVGDAWLNRRLQGELAAGLPGETAPVLQTSNATASPGGAALVAKTIAALGRRCQLVSTIGNDGTGQELAQHCIDVPDLWPRWTVGERLTLVRTTLATSTNRLAVITSRAIHADDITRTHVVRTTLAGLTEAPVGVLVIADYGEKLITLEMARQLVNLAAERQVPLFVSATAEQLFSQIYMRATAIVMSRTEARKFIEQRSLLHPAFWLEDKAEHTPAIADAIRTLMQASLVVITCGEQGVVCADGVNSMGWPPLDKYEVCDPTDAAETFLAAAVVAFLEGRQLHPAMVFANEAAGLVAKTLQAKIVTRNDMDDKLLDTDCPWRKVVSLDDAAAIAARARSREKRVAVVDDDFDLLHAGHLARLELAHNEADIVIALVTKAAGLYDADHLRVQRVSEFLRVHLVVLVDDVAEAIRKIRPLYLYKCESQRDKLIPGADYVASHGGDVRFVPMLENHAPTSDVHDSPQ